MALFSNAVHLVAPRISAEEGEFHPPSLDEFFPPAIFFEGTPFEINRIMLIRILMAIVVLLLFWLGTRKMRVIPTRGQSLTEMALDFVRVSIAENLRGKVDGKRFLPILTTMFFMIFAFNITGIIPGINMPGTALIGTPLVLAVVSYVTFIYAGIKKSPKNFFKNSLFPQGVPLPFYILVTPIEFFSTFILRPITLTLRLLMNLVVGHLLAVHPEHVHVQRPRAPPLLPDPLGGPFEASALGQEPAGVEGGVELDDEVQEGGLLGPAHRIRLVDGRHGDHVGQRRHRLTQVAGPVTEVRPHAQEGAGHER